MPRPQDAHVLLLLLVTAICVSLDPAAAAYRPATKILASSSSRAAYVSPLPPSRLLASTRAAVQRIREQQQQQQQQLGEDTLSLAAAPVVLLRKLSPLLLGFLPVLAPPSPYRQASSVANAATFTTTSLKPPTMTLAAALDDVMEKAKAGEEEVMDMVELGEGEDGLRLMGKVEPIDKLGKEAEGIFKVSKLEEGGRDGKVGENKVDRLPF